MWDGLYASIYGKSYLGLSHHTSTALSAVVMSSTESESISQQEQHQVSVSQITDNKGNQILHLISCQNVVRRWLWWKRENYCLVLLTWQLHYIRDINLNKQTMCCNRRT